MPFDVSMTLVDDYSRTTNRRFEGTATTLAQSETDEGNLATDLFAVSDMGRVKTSYSTDVAETDAAGAGANLDAGGTLHVRLNDGTVYPLKIPAIKPSLVLSSGQIDIDAAAITDYVANFLSGGAFRVGRGRYVTAILSGELDR